MTMAPSQPGNYNVEKDHFALQRTERREFMAGQQQQISKHATNYIQNQGLFKSLWFKRKIYKFTHSQSIHIVKYSPPPFSVTMEAVSMLWSVKLVPTFSLGLSCPHRLPLKSGAEKPSHCNNTAVLLPLNCNPISSLVVLPVSLPNREANRSAVLERQAGQQAWLHHSWIHRPSCSC